MEGPASDLALRRTSKASIVAGDAKVQAGISGKNQDSLGSGADAATKGSRANDTPAVPKLSKKEKRRALKGEERQADYSEKGQDGRYVRNRRGVGICRKFNAGQCGKPTGPCERGYAHQCSLCLLLHAESNCRGGGGGKGGGKGKNGKAQS